MSKVPLEVKHSDLTPATPLESKRPIRVLLIEDNPGDALLMQESVSLVAGDQFIMDCADLLSTGMKMLEEEDFDLVVLDLSLPDSRGWDTFVKVHERVPHLPLIVLSGLDDEALALKTVQEGAQDYLVKGHVDPDTLVRAMRYAIERRQAERALAEERNLLRILLDNLPDPIYVKDRHGAYLIDNQAHLEVLGVESVEKIRDKTAADFLPNEVATRHAQDDEYVISTGKSIINRVEHEKQADGSDRWALVTKVPLRNTEGKILGVVGISRDITEQKQAERQLARYNAELKEKNQQLESDQRMAREIQQALLPHQYPTFPSSANAEESALQFCHRYQPTELVGGDFYHVLALSDTEAGVFIADVMGHGVRSALVTAVLRTLVEELASAAHDPGRFLHQINRTLSTMFTRTGTLMFATAFYLIADVANNQVRFANAGGHPHPLRIRRDAHLVEPLISSGGEPGPALGLLEEAVYATSVSDLTVNDLFFFFTDGLYEVESPQGRFYNQDRLFAAVREAMNLPAPELFENLLRQIRAFSVRDDFLDDVCLVGMEVKKTSIQPAWAVNF